VARARYTVNILKEAALYAESTSVARLRLEGHWRRL
jgi:hypothetical protein